MSKQIIDFVEIIGSRRYGVRLIQELPDDSDDKESFYRDHDFDVLSFDSSDKVSGGIWESKTEVHPHVWSFSLNNDSLVINTFKFVADLAEIIEKLRVRLGLGDVEEASND